MSAAQDALAEAGGAANSLCATNTGPAMVAFSQYWDGVGDSSKTAHLRVLIDACNTLATSCDQFADAVDEAKNKLDVNAVEIAAVIAGGTVAAFFTFGAGEAVGDGVATAVGATALGTYELFGTSIASIVGTLAGGATAGLIDTAIAMAAKNTVRVAAGEQPESMTPQEAVVGLATGGIAGPIGQAISGAAKVGATSALGSIPEDIGDVAPQIPNMLAAIPHAVDTPTGKFLTDVAGQYAANKMVAGKEPTPQDIIGALVDSKIEGAVHTEENGK